MRLIATHVDDTFALLRAKLEQEKQNLIAPSTLTFIDLILFMKEPST